MPDPSPSCPAPTGHLFCHPERSLFCHPERSLFCHPERPFCHSERSEESPAAKVHVMPDPDRASLLPGQKARSGVPGARNGGGRLSGKTAIIPDRHPKNALPSGKKAENQDGPRSLIVIPSVVEGSQTTKGRGQQAGRGRRCRGTPFRFAPLRPLPYARRFAPALGPAPYTCPGVDKPPAPSSPFRLSASSQACLRRPPET